MLLGKVAQELYQEKNMKLQPGDELPSPLYLRSYNIRKHMGNARLQRVPTDATVNELNEINHIFFPDYCVPPGENQS